VLDVGCSTGGTTVALALSAALAPEVVIGVDPDRLSLRAAEVRARGHGLGPKRIAFVRNAPGTPLPFARDSFDLVVCVSVLEFVPTVDARQRLVDEMKRVVRPGGHVYLATPNPLRLRDLHAKRWLGDVVRRHGYPWASPPWSLRAMVADFERVDIDGWTLARALSVPERVVPRPLAGAFGWTRRWQRVLVRKPEAR
jgi:SAM-dependent methyltransferase